MLPQVKTTMGYFFMWLTHFKFNNKRSELKNTTNEGDKGYLTKFWRNKCLELSSQVEKGHL